MERRTAAGALLIASIVAVLEAHRAGVDEEVVPLGAERGVDSLDMAVLFPYRGSEKQRLGRDGIARNWES